MKFTKLKAVLAAALVAVAGAFAYAGDVPEESVVATGEASFWLGGDDLAARRFGYSVRLVTEVK